MATKYAKELELMHAQLKNGSKQTKKHLKWQLNMLKNQN